MVKPQIQSRVQIVTDYIPKYLQNGREGLNGILIYQLDDNGIENVEQYYIPPGYYSDINQLIHAIKETVPPSADDLTREKFKVGIGYDETKQKTWIRVS